MDSKEPGRRLFQSAENLRRSAADLSAILDYLWEKISDRRVDLGVVEDLGDENNGGKSEWLITTAFAYNARIIEPAPSERGRGRPRNPHCRGTVTFMVRLCGTEDVPDPAPNWPWLVQACLIVGWHADEKEDCWEIVHFNPSDGEGFIRNEGGKVWSWHEDGTDYSHFFVLPLFALQSEADLDAQILEPLKVLFAGGDPDDAFPANSHALEPTTV